MKSPRSNERRFRLLGELLMANSQGCVIRDRRELKNAVTIWCAADHLVLILPDEFTI